MESLKRAGIAEKRSTEEHRHKLPMLMSGLCNARGASPENTVISGLSCIDPAALSFECLEENTDFSGGAFGALLSSLIEDGKSGGREKGARIDQLLWRRYSEKERSDAFDELHVRGGIDDEDDIVSDYGRIPRCGEELSHADGGWRAFHHRSPHDFVRTGRRSVASSHSRSVGSRSYESVSHITFDGGCQGQASQAGLLSLLS